MKRISIALLVAAAAFAGTAQAQRPDTYSNIFPAITVGSTRVIGSAATGTMVDLANYAGAALVCNVGHSVDTAATRYIVLSDSAAGAAAALYDSVATDSTDNVSYKVAYRGAKRWIRGTVRGVGGTDTTFVGCSVIRTGARFRN